MTPADKFYMNLNPNCCHRADCQDRNCPGRVMKPAGRYTGLSEIYNKEEPAVYNPGKYELPNPASQEAAFKYVLNILAGIGIGAFIVAVCIWGLK